MVFDELGDACKKLFVLRNDTFRFLGSGDAVYFRFCCIHCFILQKLGHLVLEQFGIERFGDEGIDF